MTNFPAVPESIRKLATMDQRGLRQEMLAMLHDNTSVEPGLLASAHFVRGGSALPVSAAAGADGGASKAADKLEVRVKEEVQHSSLSLIMGGVALLYWK